MTELVSEARVLFQILSAWGAHPRLRIARMNTGGAMVGKGKQKRFVRYGIPGTADIVGLIAPSGRMLQIECKSATGVQSTAQKAMQRVVTDFGGIYILARCLEDVDAAMAAIGITR